MSCVRHASTCPRRALGVAAAVGRLRSALRRLRGLPAHEATCLRKHTQVRAHNCPWCACVQVQVQEQQQPTTVMMRLVLMLMTTRGALHTARACAAHLPICPHARL